MTLTDRDEAHLRRALDLAREARASGNPPFGSLLVDADGTVVAEDRNTSLTDGDITAHPELKLARWPARNAPDARGVTMYTSCEPCPMCRGAIDRSGIGRVVFALSASQLDDAKDPGAPATVTAWESDGPRLFPDSVDPVGGTTHGRDPSRPDASRLDPSSARA